MRYSKTTILSLIFHIALSTLLSTNHGKGEGDKDGQNKAQKNLVEIRIQEKPQEENKNKVEKPIDGKILVKQIKKKIIKKKIEEPKCDEFFYGIGVEQSYQGSCLVAKVYAGYPAEANGIQPGDMIVSPSCWEIRGPEGTTIDMVIMRGTQVLHLSFKRGKICGTK